MTFGERLRLSLRGLAIGEAFDLAPVAPDALLPSLGGELARDATQLVVRRAAAAPSDCADSTLLAIAPAIGAMHAEDETALWTDVETIARGRSSDLLAGMVALALAAAWAARYREHAVANARAISDDRRRFLVWIRDRLPEGAVRTGVERASQTPLEGAPADAAKQIGAIAQTGVASGEASGTAPAASRIPSAVAFVLWCAARHLDAFASALLAVKTPFIDARDPRPFEACAMLAGIVALSAGEASIPGPWLAAAPPLPPEVIALP